MMAPSGQPARAAPGAFRGRATPRRRPRREGGGAATASASSAGGRLVTKTPLPEKQRLVLRLLLGALNVALIVVAALMIVTSEQSRRLVLEFQAADGSGSSGGATAEAADQARFANITESWDDLATEVAATVLFTAMYTLVLGLVGICAVVTGRDNIVVLYLCYLIVSAVVLVYATSYAFMFRDSFNKTVEIYRVAVKEVAATVAGRDAGFADIASNVTAAGLLSYTTLSNCGLVAVVADLLQVALCVALLGCTSAIASLVMVFNIVTGVSGVLFVLLAILVYTWSVGNGAAAVVLCAAGTLCAGLSFFGFKVAEIVLDFVRATNAQMAAAMDSGGSAGAGRRRRDGGGGAHGQPPIIERTKYAKHPRLCAFTYLGAMGSVMVALLVNSIVAFTRVDDSTPSADAVEMVTLGYVVPTEELSLLLKKYFMLIAVGGLLLMLVMAFNFAGSVYLFAVAFKVSRKIKQRNRDVEFRSLLRNENGGSTSSPSSSGDDGGGGRGDIELGAVGGRRRRRSHGELAEGKSFTSSDDACESGGGGGGGGGSSGAGARATTYATTVDEDAPVAMLLSDVLESVTQFLRLNQPTEAAEAVRELRRHPTVLGSPDSRKVRAYLQILGLKIAAAGARFASPTSAEQDLMDLVSRHYLHLQRGHHHGNAATVDFSAWKRSVLEVGDPDSAAHRLADAEATAGKGSLSARSFRSVTSTREGGSGGGSDDDNVSTSDGDDMTGDEFEIVLESDDEDGGDDDESV